MKRLEKMRAIAEALRNGRVVNDDAKLVAAVKKYVAIEKEFERCVMRGRAYGSAQSMVK